MIAFTSIARVVDAPSVSTKWHGVGHCMRCGGVTCSSCSNADRERVMLDMLAEMSGKSMAELDELICERVRRINDPDDDAAP